MIQTLLRALRLTLSCLLLGGLSAAQSYCECSPGLGPCGNDAPTNLPGGCWNSQHAKGFIGPIGSTSTETDDLLFSVFNLPPKVPALLFKGSNSIRQPFGDGLLCVGAGQGGYSLFAPRITTSLGTTVWGPGLIGYAKSNFPTNGWIKPGSTWYFQVWYRDAGGPCGKGTNLTNGLGLIFVP